MVEEYCEFKIILLTKLFRRGFAFVVAASFFLDVKFDVLFFYFNCWWLLGVIM